MPIAYTAQTPQDHRGLINKSDGAARTHHDRIEKCAQFHLHRQHPQYGKYYERLGQFCSEFINGPAGFFQKCTKCSCITKLYSQNAEQIVPIYYSGNWKDLTCGIHNAYIYRMRKKTVSTIYIMNKVLLFNFFSYFS